MGMRRKKATATKKGIQRRVMGDASKIRKRIFSGSRTASKRVNRR